MKNRDVVSFWILILFVGGPCLKLVYESIDALSLNSSLGTMLWYLIANFAVVGSGLFLIDHFINMTNDLKYYRAEESKKEKEHSHIV